ncbi:MAG: F0F1 ATP synthase subunit epsilon [Chloroflexi bacterium]|nr:F0F1 ATP synthase subunit epsilon [Chloroflexota bacterium]MCY4110891.1 F0F1 ATP synthase subunit epsilon [Chloroflexota bacterium]
MAGLTLTVVSPEREVLREDDVEMVVAPGIDGELGLMPRHAPLVTQLQAGTLRYRSGGDERFLTILGGFLQVMEDTVTVLADGSERSDEIDVERAERARAEALRELEEARVGGDDATVIRARLALLRALARIRTAQRAGRG